MGSFSITVVPTTVIQRPLRPGRVDVGADAHESRIPASEPNVAHEGDGGPDELDALPVDSA